MPGAFESRFSVVLQNSESSSEDDDISSKKLESVASPRHFSREQDINLNLLQDTIHEPNILQSVSQAEMIEESGKDDNDDNDDNDDDDDFGDFDDGSQLTVEGKSEARAESTRTDISSRSHDADILSSQQHSLVSKASKCPLGAPTRLRGLMLRPHGRLMPFDRIAKNILTY